jgi:hypothetical protein
MKVLVACEYSGRVRDAFTRRGHDAISCDLLPSEEEGNHIQGDVLEVIQNQHFDLMIAHPPCTYLAHSGVRWLHEDESRWPRLDEASRFFNSLLDAPIEQICVENPVPHRYAIERIGGRKYTQLIQPWQFGHKERKATCLWLKNLSPLEPTSNLKQEMMELSYKQRSRIHWLPPSEDRWKERSRTYLGIAEAMSDQWSFESTR